MKTKSAKRNRKATPPRKRLARVGSTEWLGSVYAKWFGIRLALAFLDDYRFLKGYKEWSLTLLKVRKRRETVRQLREVATSLNELDDEMEGKRPNK